MCSSDLLPEDKIVTVTTPRIPEQDIIDLISTEPVPDLALPEVPKTKEEEPTKPAEPSKPSEVTKPETTTATDIFSYVPSKRRPTQSLAQLITARQYPTTGITQGMTPRAPGEIESEVTGKKRRNVWNEASLRLKDALGL